MPRYAHVVVIDAPDEEGAFRIASHDARVAYTSDGLLLHDDADPVGDAGAMYSTVRTDIRADDRLEHGIARFTLQEHR